MKASLTEWNERCRLDHSYSLSEVRKQRLGSREAAEQSPQPAIIAASVLLLRLDLGEEGVLDQSEVSNVVT